MNANGKRLVMVTFPNMTEGDLDRIRAVNDRLEVVFAPFMEEADTRYAVRRTMSVDEIRSRPQDLPPALVENLPRVEAMLALDVPARIDERAPKLRWIHNIGSGTDHYRGSGVHEKGITLTNSKGLAAPTMAEFILAQLLAMTKQIPERVRLQQSHSWDRRKNFQLSGATLGIIGLGAIGSEVAQRAKCFGMRVVATKRTLPDGPPPPNVDHLYRPAELPQLLAESQAVLISVAYTPETHHLIGDAELAAMPRGGYLIDVSHSGVLQEEPLIRALASGQLGGAALDTFAVEPLPPESPLWDLPNLLISAHDSATFDEYGRALTDMFNDNLRRYLRGEPLRNVVTPEAGY
jgi:phosphoglycerate dehydrogenase-like enzyme